jgi:protein-S-isoprenylcysteine O-methyltransferase Ste14
MQGPTRTIRGALFLVYGVGCYAVFLVVFLYLMGFVGNFWQTLGWNGAWFRSMDRGGVPAGIGEALLVDSLLLGLFTIQHSGMARSRWKRWWTQIIPQPIERSTFVLATSLCLALLFWQWRPLGTTVLWDLSGGPLGALLLVVSLSGWLMVLLATFMIDHFDLFGLKPVWYAFQGRPQPGPRFATPALYKAVRHPIYLGFMIAFWATPVMTLGRCLFAAGLTAYMLVAIQLEERDLLRAHGEAYREYRRRVWMLLPLPRRARPLLARRPERAGPTA